jgi:hypothetical protein
VAKISNQLAQQPLLRLLGWHTSMLDTQEVARAALKDAGAVPNDALAAIEYTA